MQLNTRDLTKISLLLALTCVSGYISIPIPLSPSPISAVTLVLNLAAFLLTPVQTFIMIAAYILLGAIGLPVFSGGTGGLTMLVGPRGGFYVGFLIAYPLISYFCGRWQGFWRYFLVSVGVGIPVTYIGGVAGMMYFLQLDLWAALVAGAFPFIFGDVLKCALASYIATKVRF